MFNATAKGDTVFFTAEIDQTKPLVMHISNTSGDVVIQSDNVSQFEAEARLTRGANLRDGDHRDFIFTVEDNHLTLRPVLRVGETVSSFAGRVKRQLKDGFNAEDWNFRAIRGEVSTPYDISVRLPKQLPEGSSLTVSIGSGDVRAADLDIATTVHTGSGDCQLGRIGAATVVNSGSGDVNLEQVTGKVKVNAGRGDVIVREMTGSIAAHVGSGDILLNNVDAWAALRTVSGDITVRDSSLKNASLASGNGDITVNATLPNTADYSFSTVSGDVTLNTRVPQHGAQLKVNAFSGDVQVSGNWITGPESKTWQLANGTDGPRISVNTMRSDINAVATADETLTPTREALPNDVDVEQQQLELEGEMARMDDKVTAKEAKAEQAASNRERVDIDLDNLELDKAVSWLKGMGKRVTRYLNDVEQSLQQSEAEADATAKTSASAPTEPVAAPAPPAAPEPVAAPEPDRRMKLLEQVKNGEITIEEALAQLDDTSR